MTFEQMTQSVPDEFIEHTKVKYESKDFSLPISLEELEESCIGDELCEKALSEMVRYCIEYSQDVWAMKLLARDSRTMLPDEFAEKLAEADNNRTRLHNATIDSIAILSRALIAAEKDADWVRSLAPTGKLERAACGKFAIMLTYYIAVNSRK